MKTAMRINKPHRQN